MLLQATVGKLCYYHGNICDTFTEDEDTKGRHAEAVLKSKIQIFSQRQAAVPNRKAQSVKQCTGAHIQRIQRVI